MIVLSLIQIGNALYIPSKFLTITSENVKTTKAFTASLSASLCILSGFPINAYAQNIASEIKVSDGLEQPTIKSLKISNLKTYLKIPLQNANGIVDSFSDVKVEKISNRDESSTKSTPYNQNKWKLCYAPQTKNLGNILLTDLSMVYAYDDEMDDNNKSTRIKNNGVSSHIFYKNLFFNGWINISGEYQDVDGFICRVIWKDLWYVSLQLLWMLLLLLVSLLKSLSLLLSSSISSSSTSSPPSSTSTPPSSLASPSSSSPSLSSLSSPLPSSSPLLSPSL
jgi:hypothetical protein